MLTVDRIMSILLWGKIFRKILALPTPFPKNPISPHACNVFDRYFYFRRNVFSEERLQPFILVVPSLFQELSSFF